MDHALLVHRLQAAGDLHPDQARQERVQQVLGNGIAQGVPAQKLHHEVRLIRRQHAKVADLDDVGMVNARGDARLLLKALAVHLVLGRTHHLERKQLV